MIAYRQIGERFIPARHQPALVLDFARSQELDGDAGSAQILRGTGLDGWDLPAADQLVTPQEYLQLLAQLTRALGSPETSFLLGQQMLPGHYGALSHALLQAQNLRQALEILCLGHAQLCPLLTPRFREEGGLAVLYWRDSFGAPSQLPALVEMHMTAVTAMCRWLGGEALPWRYCLNRSAPAHVEQHEVHLGSDLRFNCHLDAMLIAPALLDRPWPRGNAMAASAAMQAALAGAQSGMQAIWQVNSQPNAQAGAQVSGAAGAGAVAGLVSGSTSGSVSNSVSNSVPNILTPGLLAALYDYLLEHIRLGPTLEGTAQAFGVSPATLKRHLARHGSHFQAELDGVRAHVAMQLFQMRGYDNEAVAHYLGFHDATNFRRSFKRWTGLVPSLLRDGLLRG